MNNTTSPLYKKNRPLPHQIKKFLEIFDKLDAFSSQIQLIRGYGAIDQGQCPIPEVVTVYNWLKELSK